MNLIKSLRIQAKLILLVVIFFIAAGTMFVYSYVNLNILASLSSRTYNTVSVPMGYLSEISSSYSQIRASIRDLAITVDVSETESYIQLIQKSITNFDTNTRNYQSYINTYGAGSKEEEQAFNNIAGASSDFKKVVNKIVEISRTNDLDATINVIHSEFVPVGNIVNENLISLSDINVRQSEDSNNQSDEAKSSSITILLAVFALSIIILLVLAYLIIVSITRPVKQMVEVANNVAAGNLNVNIENDSKDEIGILAAQFSKVVSTLRGLLDDLEFMSKQHDIGQIDEYLKIEKYSGSYREVTNSINHMVQSHIDVKKMAMSCLDEMAKGNFNVEVKVLPGKKIFVTNALVNMRTGLKNISTEVEGMIKNTIAGNLSAKIDSAAYSGDWGLIMSGLNDVLDAVNKPIKEVMDVTAQMSQGNFSARINGSYKGDFDSLKDSVNVTVTNISGYIMEISDVLTQLANNNFDQSIDGEYLGDFDAIKSAFNEIVSNLNQVISDIGSASDLVDNGAKQISNSSMMLANGATEQASSVQELTASVDLINQQTQANADNAEKANALSISSKQNAEVGNEEMKEMISAMEGIKASSDNIAKIIKVIDDIAFQTNLLALNAAVEAARAGEQGKGFAVVAEEVRNLAARSQSAARDTTQLIDDSIARVNKGATIASSTALSLEKIVGDINNVSGIINEIATASKEQAMSISQVSLGLSQISIVVQSNSSTSEESASASEELASQAETLKNMVSVFNLRR